MGFGDWVTNKFFKSAIDNQIVEVVNNPERLLQATSGETLEKALVKLPVSNTPVGAQKGLDFDPFAMIEALGWKKKASAMTFDTLRAMSLRLAPVGNIILLRMNQVSSFGAPYRQTKNLGFVIKHKDPEHAMLKSEKKRAAELEEYITQCGKGPNKYRSRPRDDFETFLKKIVQDSLVMDQVCHPAGTMIEMASLVVKAIEDIVVGDLVRTHTGKVQKVIELKNRIYTGDMYTVKSFGQEVIATEDHPLLAFINNKVEWVKIKDLTDDHCLVYPKQKTTGYRYIEILSIEKKSVIEIPVYNFEVEEDHSYVANGYVSHNCIEIVKDRSGRPFEFLALDGGTIRIAADHVNNFLNIERARSSYFPMTSWSRTPVKLPNGKEPAFIQVIRGQLEAVFAEDEMIFGVRNPQTSIRNNGYGQSELERIVTTVTAHLFAEEFNRRQFMQGAAPKGILNIKNAEFGQEQLESFRRIWRANIAGVENCISGNTPIFTEQQGLIKIGALVGDQKEQAITVWTGTEWKEASAYRTSEDKVLCQTGFTNGIEVETSPDHRFLTIMEDGELGWKSQEELKEGDFVAVNKSSIQSHNAKIPEYKGQAITAEFMEVLGWLIGDGYIDLSTHHDNRLFYHPTKEPEILDRHLSILQRFGIDARKHEHIRTEKQILRIKEAYGFKTVQDREIRIQIQDGVFSAWLRDNKFSGSCDGKQIPGWVYVLPDEYKHGFLKGIFSADGNFHKKRSPCITIADDRLREQVRLLLASGGIRTSLSEGKTNITFTEDGASREYVQKKSVLRVRDWAGVDSPIARQTVHKYGLLIREKSRELVESDKLTKVERNGLNGVICGSECCTLPRLLRFMDRVGFDCPSWLTEYHFEKVSSKTQTDRCVPMYDVEVYDDQHKFVCGSIVTHNSWRMPVLASEGLEFINLSPNNRDAEFMAWMEYLLKISTGAYQLDPSEINFEFGGGANSPLFERLNESKVKTSSKDKGLRPLLRFIAKMLNRGIIDKIDDRFRMEFVGLDDPTDDQRLEMVKTKISTYMTVNEIRQEEGLEPKDGGDVVLNPIFSQRQAMVEQQAQEEEQAVSEQQQQEEEAAQEKQTKTGDKDKAGKKVLDPTGAVSSKQHQELESSGSGKDKRIPRGTDNNVRG